MATSLWRAVLTLTTSAGMLLALPVASSMAVTSMAATPTGPVELTPPRVTVTEGPTPAYASPGGTVAVSFRVNDDNAGLSVRAQLFTGLYASGGTLVDDTNLPEWVDARPGTEGNVYEGDFTVPVGDPGPFYACGWARATTNLASAHAPTSACVWVPVVIDPASVSEGCPATSAWAPKARFTRAWMRDTQDYRGTTVDFRTACQWRDAGYRGLAVNVPGEGLRDYRTWSRSQVDAQFLTDLRAACTATLTSAVARRLCTASAGFSLNRPYRPVAGKVPGAQDYLRATRQLARGAFDVDLTLAEIQNDQPTASSYPEGGIRDGR